VSEVLVGLGPEMRQKIEQLRAADHYFWIDVVVENGTRDALAEVLEIPAHALAPLLDFSPQTPPSRKWHADGEHVVFSFTAFLDYERGPEEEAGRLDAVEVHVLVHGDYVLTVHQVKLSLPALLGTETPERGSEQYIVYSVLDAMVETAFDALNETEQAMAELELAATDMRGARVRMATLRAISARLSAMRRRLSPQRGIFERVATEISHVEGLSSDSDRYFERIYGQLNRLVGAIDAATQSLAQLIDLRLNETMYWLTVVATVFLPLTFITGFFGMNFGWMVDRIDTAVAFFALGVGGCVLGVVVTMYLVRRRGTPVEEDRVSAEGLGRFRRAGARGS
jgi:magnesium transporter